MNVYSSGPPNGLEGQSASMPRITSTGSPPATGRTNRCERRPSFQVSQCRMNSRSKILPVVLAAAVSSRRSFVQLASAQSGKTSIDSASRSPVGATARLVTSSGRSVTCSASPPSIEILHTCDESERVERNQTLLPSGDHRGL